MFALSKYNLCDYITFIPEDYRYEAGLTLYLAILEGACYVIEYFIEKSSASIKCVFYKDEKREDGHAKPVVTMSQKSLDVGSVWCHLVVAGNWKKLSKSQIILDIPEWFSAQIENDSFMTQENHKVIWNISSLLPANDNKKLVYVENRMKLSFIRNKKNNVMIDIEPTISEKRGLDFETNGLTVQNMEC